MHYAIRCLYMSKLNFVVVVDGLFCIDLTGGELKRGNDNLNHYL